MKTVTEEQERGIRDVQDKREKRCKGQDTYGRK
jgi:hypothetical protein